MKSYTIQTLNLNLNYQYVDSRQTDSAHRDTSTDTLPEFKGGANKATHTVIQTDIWQFLMTDT